MVTPDTQGLVYDQEVTLRAETGDIHLLALQEAEVLDILGGAHLPEAVVIALEEVDQEVAAVAVEAAEAEAGEEIKNVKICIK